MYIHTYIYIYIYMKDREAMTVGLAQARLVCLFGPRVFLKHTLTYCIACSEKTQLLANLARKAPRK